MNVIKTATAVCFGLGLASANTYGKSQKPNIILVMADDQGWGLVCADGR